MQTDTIAPDGVVTYWQAGTARLSDLISVADQVGLADAAPRGHRAESVLRDAIAQAMGRAGKDAAILVRPLAARRGWHIVIERRGNRANDYESEASIALDGDDIAVIHGYLPDHIMTAIREHLNELTGTLASKAVGEFLVRAVADCYGVSLKRGRGSGGVYWIPRAFVSRWREIASAIEQCAVERDGIVVYTVSVSLTDDRSLRAMRDAIVREIAHNLNEITSGLESLGSRALENRAERAKELRARLAEYKAILGDAAAACEQAIADAQSACADAAMQAIADAMPDVA